MKNRRTYMTKRIIKESLIDLLEKKSIDQITVSELCKEADINRSTFYAHYVNVIDVIEEIKNEFIFDYMPFVKKIEMSNHILEKESFMKFFENMKIQNRVLRVLVKNTDIVNDVTQPMRINMKNLYYTYWGNVPESFEIYLDAAATYITFGFFATVNRWLELGSPNNAEYLYKMIDLYTRELFDKLKNKIYNIK